MNKSSSKLLIDNRTGASSPVTSVDHPFRIQIELAADIGLNESIVLHRLHELTTDNEASSEFEGHRWFKATADDWHRFFPFWSHSTSRRVIASLEAAGFIRSTVRFNIHQTDRTKWYAVDYDVLDARQARTVNPSHYRKHPIPRWLRKSIMERDMYRCQKCGDHRDLSIDHIIPESRGGTLDPQNLQTLCRSCNSSKGVR